MINSNLKSIRTTSYIVLITFVLTMALTNTYKIGRIAAVPNWIKTRDFMSYYTTGIMAQNGQWRKIYDRQTQKQHFNSVTGFSHELPFMALPITSMVFLPLSFFSVRHAYILYMGICILIITLVGKKFGYPYLGFLALAFSPAAFSISQGQTTVFVFLGMSMAYLSLTKGKPFNAGLWYSLCLFKLQFIVGIPFALIAVKEKKDFVKGLLPLSGLGILSTFLPYGGLLGFVRLLHGIEIVDVMTNPRILISSQYFIQNALNTNEVASIVVTLMIYLLLWGIFYLARAKLPLNEAYTICILVSLVFGFHVHIHDQLLLLIPAILLGYEQRYRPIIIGGFIVITLIFLRSPLFIAPLLTLAILYILTYKYVNEKNRRNYKEQKQIGGFS